MNRVSGVGFVSICLLACASGPDRGGADDFRWPCGGRGELLHEYESATNPLPPDATVTRQALRHGVWVTCYTTPKSLADAAERERQARQ